MVVFVDLLLVIISLFRGRSTFGQLWTVKLGIALLPVLNFFSLWGGDCAAPNVKQDSTKTLGMRIEAIPLFCSVLKVQQAVVVV